MKWVLTLFTVLYLSCDIDMNADVHDNIINLDFCSILNPDMLTCSEDNETLDIPRTEGEPCDATHPCYRNYICLCHICVDPRDVNL